jgi:hypothetical protein
MANTYIDRRDAKGMREVNDNKLLWYSKSLYIPLFIFLGNIYKLHRS